MTNDEALRAAREEVLARYLAVWQGEADLETISELVTDDYVGHVGLRSRALADLKRDIAAYSAAFGSVRFSVHDRFGEGDYIATRLMVRAVGQRGEELEAAGMNMSLWRGDRLAEEWAVWEALHPVAST